MSKRLTGITLILLSLGIGALASGRWWMGESFPQTIGTLRLDGLEETVEIRRDAGGIPHLHATSLHDLYYAQGVVHAQDRLWQMDVQRRTSLGRLSELLGEPAVESDRLARTLGLSAAADRDLENLSDEGRAALQAYADGVNAYVENFEKLPVEYDLLGVQWEQWEPVHSLAWLKVYQWQHAGDWEEDLLRAQLLQRLDRESASLLLGQAFNTLSPIPDIGQPDLDALRDGLSHSGWGLGMGNMDRGSNAWVIPGERTASGRPILASSSQTALQLPAQWYPITLRMGAMNAAGVSLPGVPAILMGHNGHIAWAGSNAPVDSQDLFIERLDGTGTAYEWQGEQESLALRDETIQVRGGEPVSFVVRESHHGPLLDTVISGLAEPVALQWTATAAPSTLFDAILAMNLARDQPALFEAVEQWGAPAQTIVYALPDGTTGRVAAGAVPVRASGGGMIPLAGWTGEGEWQGTEQAASQAQEGAREQESLVLAEEASAAGDATSWCGSPRATRVRDLLAEGDDVTVEDVEAMMADVLSPLSPAIVPYLLAPQSDDIIVQRAQEQLAAWNHQMKGDLPGASIYQVTTGFLFPYLLADDFGADEPSEQLLLRYLDSGCAPFTLLLDLLAEPQHPLWDDTRTAASEHRDDIILRALVEMTDWLGRRYGDVPHEWFWKRPLTARLTHPLDGIAPVAPPFFNRAISNLGGDWSTLNTTGFSYEDDYRASTIPAYRQIIDVGEWDNSVLVLAGGLSGQPMNPHYADLLEAWESVQFRPMAWSESGNVRGDRSHVLRLVP